MLVYPEQQSSSKDKDSVLFGLQLEAGRHCKGEGKQVFEENTKPSQTYKIDPRTHALSTLTHHVLIDCSGGRTMMAGQGLHKREQTGVGWHHRLCPRMFQEKSSVLISEAWSKDRGKVWGQPLRNRVSGNTRKPLSFANSWFGILSVMKSAPSYPVFPGLSPNPSPLLTLRKTSKTAQKMAWEPIYILVIFILILNCRSKEGLGNLH